MNLFDEETGPAAFSQILQPQEAQAQPQAPEMPGGLGAVLMGGASDPEQPSLFERGRQFAQENPMAAHVLLNTFMTMARGGHSSFGEALGQGVANGAVAGLTYQAQGKADKEKAEKDAREKEIKDKELNLRERGVNIQEGQFNLQQAEAPVKRRYQTAQAASLEQQTGERAANAGLMTEQLRARIAQIQSEIANTKDLQKSRALQRTLTGLQIAQQQFELDMDKEYKPGEREAALTGKQLNNQGQNIQNQAGQQQLDDEATLSPQERLARTAKGTKAAKTDDEMFNEFFTRNADIFNGDGAKARAAWAAAGNGGKAGASAVLDKTHPEFKARLDAARSAVKIGETYRRPDGQLAIRKN